MDGRTRLAQGKKRKLDDPTVLATQSLQLTPSSSSSEVVLDSSGRGAVSPHANFTEALLEQAIPFDPEFQLDRKQYEKHLQADPLDVGCVFRLDLGKNGLVPPRTMDFAALVRGIELSPETGEVRWPGGFTTCVPFIPQENDPSKNILVLVGLRLPSLPVISVLF